MNMMSAPQTMVERPPAINKKASASGEAVEVNWSDRGLVKFLLFIAVPVAGILLWQLFSEHGILISSMPSPIEAAETLGHWIFGVPKSSIDIYAGTWWTQVVASSQRVLIGYALAALVGIPLGVLIGANKVAYALLDHVIQALRTVPAPAWVPFTLAFFGLSPLATVWLISLVAFFPIVVNTVSGIQQVSPLLRNAARMLGAKPFYVWRRVLVPAALPFIFVGLRIAAGMAWIAVVVSELVGVKSGLGYSLYQSYQFGRMDIMIGTMFTLGVFGLISDRAVGFVARKVIKV
jgi:NitT/TauT family transport system permease protein